ncbi:TIGR00180 family glycosyltransferase [Candidatus Pelagibacter sp.]|nr:TIGR00180 family glycosyltransferase [Candidatus Pelagibacter sp.]
MCLDKSNFFLKKLTIIIPTYKRQKFALRAMKYWSGKAVRVIIVDGSKKPINDKHLNQLKPNIRYVHNPVKLYKRLFATINLINTQYVMLGCDDEFYIPSALSKCINRLSQDPKLVTCTGLAFKFEWNGKSVVAYDIYSKLINRNLNNPDPMIRLKTHFSDYVPLHMYGVTQSSLWKIAAKAIFSKEYSFFAAGEIQIEFLLLFAGKSLVIPEILWMRSGEALPQRGDSPSMITSKTLLKWWFNKKYRAEKKDFLSRMELTCKKINKKKRDKFIVNTQSILEDHIKSEKENLFFSIYKKLPKIIRTKIKKLLKIFGYELKNKILLLEYVKLLKKRNIKVDLKEIKKIKKIVNSYYQKPSNLFLGEDL